MNSAGESTTAPSRAFRGKCLRLPVINTSAPPDTAVSRKGSSSRLGTAARRGTELTASPDRGAQSTTTRIAGWFDEGTSKGPPMKMKGAKAPRILAAPDYRVKGFWSLKAVLSRRTRTPRSTPRLRPARECGLESVLYPRAHRSAFQRGARKDARQQVNGQPPTNGPPRSRTSTRPACSFSLSSPHWPSDPFPLAASLQSVPAGHPIQATCP